MRTPISVVCLCSGPFSVCNLSLYCTFSHTGTYTGRTRLTESKEAEVAKLNLRRLLGDHSPSSLLPAGRQELLWVEDLESYIKLLETEYGHLFDEVSTTSAELATQTMLVKEYTTFIESLKADKDILRAENDVLSDKLAKAGDAGGDGGPAAEAKLNEVLRKQVQDLTDKYRSAREEMKNLQSEFTRMVDINNELTEDNVSLQDTDRARKAALEVKYSEQAVVGWLNNAFLLFLSGVLSLGNRGENFVRKRITDHLQWRWESNRETRNFLDQMEIGK